MDAAPRSANTTTRDPRFAAPAIALPRGGGALKGIGEKFGANAATGTGSLTIGLPLSPGRGGLTPELTLRYDSGAGNGPYGFGWAVNYAAISRRTDRGLPKYLDSIESDVFLLSGAEDLVPVLDAGGNRVSTERDGYRVHQYRPRIEGLFARIERWANLDQPADTYWRTITRDNVTTVYGRLPSSRVADPEDETRIFSWLVSEVHDDKGNAAVYEYAAEDSRGIDLGSSFESPRSVRSRSANRYLSRVKYGNAISRLQPAFASTTWLFELVMDYGDFAGEQPAIVPSRDWTVRPDPFSSHRSGFEVRTYRRCERVLMFHHFAELGAEPRLVRSLSLDYEDLDYAQAVAAQTELSHAGSTRLGSFLRRATLTGFADSGAARSMPPLELTYTRPAISSEVRSLDQSETALHAAPDGTRYRWVDLNGEGLTGVLTTQGGAWWYTGNLGNGLLAARQQLADAPALDLDAGAQFLDLGGDGLLDVVRLTEPGAGFYERTVDERWSSFTPFLHHPNVAWDSPTVRFVDLTGDGHADVLIIEDDLLVWHESLGEAGYGARESIRIVTDEAAGPRLVFNDSTDTIFLADMTGDGLSDLVRIRNGEISYWSNLGYGRFGPRIVMDGSPVFDAPDAFDPKRIRLGDIDGSGVADVIYLAPDGVRLYFNCAGNRWTPALTLAAFPQVDNVVDVAVMDLLGNGTACLVWSSPLPLAAAAPVRFIDLMGGTKPHLLAGVADNLGLETTIEYAASTRFYAADRLAGRPWISRLPFPVHVVERVETRDRIGGSRFTSRYAYHHGFFDGVEREFRGFGMVEQWDSDALVDATSDVPPVLTRTWFHTGVHVGRDHVSDFFAGLAAGLDAGDYYREPGLTDDEARTRLLADTVLPGDLSVAEEREACRALKGVTLRQEIYARDGTRREPHPYVVSEQNFAVRLLQPQGPNPHAVFFVHPLEAIRYHYDREPSDPRVAHDLTLDVDAFGNVLAAAAVVYGRRTPDLGLAANDRARQAAIHVTCTDATVTNAVDDPDQWRTPLASESHAFELTGMEAPASGGRFSLSQVRDAVTAAAIISFEQPPTAGTLQKRIIQQARTFYSRDDLTGALPLGVLESLALPFESHSLVFTSALIAAVFGDRVTTGMLSEAGYVATDNGAKWWARPGRVFYSPFPEDSPAAELDYARRHFFRPCRFRDPFHTPAAGTEQIVLFDSYDLLMLETRDPLGNRVTAGERNPDGSLLSAGNDYRVLQPRVMTDPNGNRSAVAYDALGVTVGTATMGKMLPAAVEGDSLDGFVPDLPEAVVLAHLADPFARVHEILGRASSRVLYDAFAYARTRDSSDPQPTVMYAMTRETHAADLAGGEQTRIQHAVAYSDGLGREIQRKSSAEPGPVPIRGADGRLLLDADGEPQPTPDAVSPRWRTTGWVVFDNKGNPVRAYEPFFSDRHAFEPDLRIGVSLRVFYDPLDRAAATLHPNHTWEKILHGPWTQETWDVNDTVRAVDPALDPDVGGFFARLPDADYLPTWFAARDSGVLGADEQTAARKAAVHGGTPSLVHGDSLGRGFLSIRHNAKRHGDAPAGEPRVEERYETRTEFDIQGNRLAVVDANGRVTTRCQYSVAGTLLHHVSMDAGETWMLADVTGQPLYAWESHGYRFRMSYDRLRRPVDAFVMPAGASVEIVAQRIVYGDDTPNAETANLRGRVLRVFDQSGAIGNERYDFKGNPLSGDRQMVQAAGTTIDWAADPPLEPEVFTTSLTYDALDRLTAATAPDGSIYRTFFNDGALLARLQVNLHGEAVATTFVAAVEYDARGWRTGVQLGNGVETRYTRDRLTKLVTRVTTTRPTDGGILQDLQYTFDPAGNPSSITDGAQQTIYFSNQAVSPTASYTYDAIYRLIDAEGREHAGQATSPQATWNDEFRTGLPHPGDGQAMRRYRQQYEYDAVGNLRRLIHQAVNGEWTRDYAYDEPSPIEPARRSNRLSRTEVGSVNPLVEPFTYDAHGNTTSTAHLTMLQWDFWNRLQATSRQIVTSGDAETTRYAYDAKGQRSRKTTRRANGSRKNERTYVGGFEVYREFDSTGDAIVLERQTLHVADDTGRLALIETRTRGTDGSPAEIVRYQCGNQIASCSLELDAAAGVISYEEYTPYGSTSYQAVRNQTDAPKRYRYSGMERDEESGLSYHGARYYAPWLGKWISPDPLQDHYPRWEPYAYAFNNPLSFTDPSGLGPETNAEKYMRRLVQDAIRDSNTFGGFLEDIKRELKDLHSETKRLRAEGKSATDVEQRMSGKYADLRAYREEKLPWAQEQAKSNIRVAEQLLEVEKQHMRTLLVDVESPIPVRTPLTEAADKLKQRIREASALDITLPKPPPPPKKKKPPAEKKPEIPEAKARFPNEESGWTRFWKKFLGGGKKISGYGPHLFAALDFWDAYTRISGESTTYGQIKETSFWGGRLFGAAMGAKYGAAFGPWGALAGMVLGAIIGENAVKSVFAVAEELVEHLAGPITKPFVEGFEALKDPEVQRYINKGVNRLTGADEIHSGFDRMYNEMDRQSQERR